MLSHALIDPGVALLRLERPDKRNALSIELRAAIAEALGSIARDEAVRATVVVGEGSAFCAGMDTGQFGGDDSNRRALYESSVAFGRALADHPKPLVTAVNGPALGGGFVLALLCDLRIAGRSATFGFPELRRGIPASLGAARAALAPAVAADLSLTGRLVGADEALALGVVSAVVDDDVLLDAARERAAQIAALPPSGPQTVKEWAREGGDWRELLAREERAFRDALGLPE